LTPSYPFLSFFFLSRRLKRIVHIPHLFFRPHPPHSLRSQLDCLPSLTGVTIFLRSKPLLVFSSPFPYFYRTTSRTRFYVLASNSEDLPVRPLSGASHCFKCGRNFVLAEHTVCFFPASFEGIFFMCFFPQLCFRGRPPP